MHPQDQSEEFGDGYANELQRAFAIGQNLRQRIDDQEKARDLARNGRSVVMVEHEVSCPFTDAFIGMDYCIYGDYEFLQDALTVIVEHNDDSYHCFYLIAPDTLKREQQEKAIQLFQKHLDIEAAKHDLIPF